MYFDEVEQFSGNLRVKTMNRTIAGLRILGAEFLVVLPRKVS